MTTPATATTTVSAPSATLVPDDRRMDFLPALFGLSLLMIGEQTVYSFMDRLSPDYAGGMWEFLEHGGVPLYLRPGSDARFRIVCDMNDFEGNATADAAGIIASLFAFSHLSFRDRSDRMVEAYHRLYGYAADHPEARTIFAAID